MSKVLLWLTFAGIYTPLKLEDNVRSHNSTLSFSSISVQIFESTGPDPFSPWVLCQWVFQSCYLDLGPLDLKLLSMDINLERIWFTSTSEMSTVAWVCRSYRWESKDYQMVEVQNFILIRKNILHANQFRLLWLFYLHCLKVWSTWDLCPLHVLIFISYLQMSIILPLYRSFLCYDGSSLTNHSLIYSEQLNKEKLEMSVSN